MNLRMSVILPVALLLAGCAAVAPPPPDAAINRCLDLYGALDEAVSRHGVTPSSPARIEGFPYLRVDRFLASYRRMAMDHAQRQAWLARLAELDRQARVIELDSLPPAVRRGLEVEHTGVERLADGLASCSRRLQVRDLENAPRFAALRERAVVPSDYRTLYQILGLYPLTVLPVNYGIYLWHRETRDLFAKPLEALPVRGELRRFRPPGAVTKPISMTWSRDALGIPTPAPEQLDRLFSAHGPVWEIDVAGVYDRPGVPVWQRNGVPAVNPDQPVVYRYVTYTRWQGAVLLQLNYLIWFAGRPLSGPLDILGGALDGLLWRVTLDREGKPLLYDTIHPCGCYHHFFPSPVLALRPAAERLLEPPLVPQPAPDPNPDERVVIRVESGTHYLQRVYTDIPSGADYAWRPYQSLYATPVTGGERRSLFAADGLVPGSARRERWLLWPMGIPSPGAMRERGRHATAFAGRRHFDDPYLLERLFEPMEERSAKCEVRSAKCEVRSEK